LTRFLHNKKLEARQGGNHPRRAAAHCFFRRHPGNIFCRPDASCGPPCGKRLAPDVRKAYRL